MSDKYISECDWLNNSHVCFVTPATLFKHKLLHNSFIKLTVERKLSDSGDSNLIAKDISNRDIVAYHFRDHEAGKNDFIMQLFVVEDFRDMDLLHEVSSEKEENQIPVGVDLKTDYFYVSPLALLNVCKRDVSVYNSIRMRPFPISMTTLRNVSDTEINNYAVTISISQISCPSTFHIPEDDVNLILHRYFKTRRLLQADEIFVVNHSAAMNHEKDFVFRVSNIECANGYKNTGAVYIDKELTTLFLSNRSNNYVPSCACIHDKNIAMRRYLNHFNLNKLFEKPLSTLENLFKNSMCDNNLNDSLVLLDCAKGMGKRFMLRHFCLKFCLHYDEINSFDLIGDSLSATEKRITKALATSANGAPCLLHVKYIHVLCRDKEGLNEERRVANSFLTAVNSIQSKLPIIIVASTNQVRQLTERFHSSFFYHIKLEQPDFNERTLIIGTIAKPFTQQVVSNIANKTSGFVFADLLALFRNLRNKNENFLEFSNDEKNILELDNAIEQLRKLKAGKNSDIGKIPNVKWADVGGLQGVKNDVFDTIDLPLRYPHMFKNDFKRSGLLLYGNPGCGKTLLAKAIATEFSLNFYSVKGPELISMYVGQSEENIRNVFDKARAMSPCVIFFDELDSLAPKRGRSGDSGGVMDRIVSQLLAELDGIHDNTDLFIVGATNRPDLLDTALLRPGRFDKLIYVGLPKGAEERLKILKAVTRKLKTTEDVSLEEIENACPENMTGADFSALASDAVMTCYRRLILVHETSGVPLDANDVIISNDDFLHAVETFTPSLSQSELQRYEHIRENMEMRNL